MWSEPAKVEQPRYAGSLLQLRRAWRRPGLGWVLGLVLVLAYLPSLGGGFLNYDDPWLIEKNALLRDPAGLRKIWFDLSPSTRLGLGAEYLPLRDTSHWLELSIMGEPRAPAMRTVQLLLFVAAALLFRIALRAVLARPGAGELAAWLYALHPAHTESVAWLAGRKNVLALLCWGGVLALYARRARHRNWAVPLLVAGGILSRSMSVAALALLPAVDLLAHRRPDYRLYALSLLPLPLLLPALRVATEVGMISVPRGSTFELLATTGSLWLRYLECLVWPPALSVVHDATTGQGWTLVAVSGWLLILVWTAAGTYLAVACRRNLVLVALTCFCVPLLPASQLPFSLQNLMADRHLYLSVLAPSLLLGGLLGGRERAGLVVGLGLLLTAAGLTSLRSRLFSDSVLVFADATRKTRTSGVAAYQLGQAYEERGDDRAAIRAYQLVLQRERPPAEVARRATNNLARLLARAGELGRAERLLRRAVIAWPDDPRLLGNLAEVLARQGRSEEARERFETLLRRFPDYEWGRARYRAHYPERPERPSLGTSRQGARLPLTPPVPDRITGTPHPDSS